MSDERKDLQKTYSAGGKRKNTTHTHIQRLNSEKYGLSALTVQVSWESFTESWQLQQPSHKVYHMIWYQLKQMKYFVQYFVQSSPFCRLSHPNNKISKRKEFDKSSFLRQQVAFSGVKMLIILCTAALVDPIWALGGTNKQTGVKFSLVYHFSEITRFATHFLSCFGPIFSLVLKGLNRSQSFDQIRTVQLFIKKTALF